MEKIIFNHIIPLLGEKQLQKLTPVIMENYFLDLKTRRYKPSKYGYKNVSDDELPTFDKILQRMRKEEADNPYRKLLPIIVFPNTKSVVEPSKVKTCLVLKELKTKGSIRTVYMTKHLMRELLERKQRVARRMLLLGKDYHNYDLVICQDDGWPMESALIRKKMRKLIDKFNGEFPVVTLHSLRATSTTYKLIVSHGDIKAVQGDTGHATAEMVPDQYARIQDKNRKKLEALIEERFYKDRTISDLPKPRTEAEVNSNLQLMKKLAEKLDDPEFRDTIMEMLG